MESFVHLRKGRTPQRQHADLDGLKDDELGRGGFTGRTANMYRRNDPTAYRSVGPLRPLDVLAGELKPSDATEARGGPLLLFANADCQISLSRRTEELPFFECGPDIAVPALVIGNLADDACTPSHTHRLFDAIGHPDKEMHEVAGANHYYAGPDQRDKLREAVGIVTDWLRRHSFSL